jgi:hypothetical protein
VVSVQALAVAWGIVLVEPLGVRMTGGVLAVAAGCCAGRHGEICSLQRRFLLRRHRMQVAAPSYWQARGVGKGEGYLLLRDVGQFVTSMGPLCAAICMPRSS